MVVERSRSNSGAVHSNAYAYALHHSVRSGTPSGLPSWRGTQCLLGKRDGAEFGARLLKRVGEVMNRMGTHLRRGDGTFPPAGKGDPDAFEQFLDTELAFKPKDASTLMV